VTINIDDDEIRIADNGRGFPYEELKQYLAPEGTDKTELFKRGDVRGHKGVGLTFLAYGFNYFQLQSKTPGSDPYSVTLEGGRDWVEGDEIDPASRPTARPDPLAAEERGRGTEVVIQTDRASNPSNLSYTFNTAEMTATILETQTAIGVVPPRTKSHPSVDAKLVYISDGEESVIDLDDDYRFPHQKLNDDLGDGDVQMETIDIDEYDYDDDADDAQQGVLPTDQNRYHGVYKTFDAESVADRITADHTGEELKEPDAVEEYIREHDLQVYVLFTYSNEYRNRLKDRWGILGNRKFHQPGIRIATDGMISSWHQPVNLTYSGPRESRLWFAYHFQDVRPDTGRKDFPQSVHDVVEGTKQFLHRTVVEDGEPFLRPTPRSGAGGEELGQPPAVKAREKDDISPAEFDAFGPLPQVKVPEEEHDVVALFNQMIGMGALKYFDPYYFSSRDAYDGYVEYDPDSVPSEVTSRFPGAADVSGRQASITLEFKQQGVDIIEHVVNQTREWEEMDLLICWELGGSEVKDGSIVAKREYGGRTITFREPTSQEERQFAGVTHISHMSSKGDVGLRTISLKHFAENL
jgi:hypothetical protein